MRDAIKTSGEHETTCLMEEMKLNSLGTMLTDKTSQSAKVVETI
jgi:hypothetical protein